MNNINILLNKIVGQAVNSTGNTILDNIAFQSHINSPLEPLNENLISVVIHYLSQLVILQYITVYLTTMSIIVLTCKIIIDYNINLDILKKYYLGKYLQMLITWYISMYKKSAYF